MGSRLHTVGHSNRSIEQLLALLGEAGIRTLVDVRAWPCSKRHPHFDHDPLQAALRQAGIDYHWAGKALGGRRPSRRSSPDRALPEGFSGYAAHMRSEPFRGAIEWLIELADTSPTAIMCAERQPEQCHRRLISDYLLSEGAEVLHLIQFGEQRRHRLSDEARQSGEGLCYDRHTTAELDF